MPAAARVTDNHICPLIHPPPHVGGPILAPGALTVQINGFAAARVGDKAFCVGVPPDTLRGGSLSVLIENAPATRLGDSTDVGKVVMGSTDVDFGDWGGGALSPDQAQWLYDYLASQGDIPFEYATEGCFARADRMAARIDALGIDVRKQFVYSTNESGLLSVPIANYPGGGVTWGYHVAPIVNVSSAVNGQIAPMVMDPSLGAGPLSVDGWIGLQTSNPGEVISETTDRDVYFRDVTGAYEESSDLQMTSNDLEKYREE